MSNIYKIECFKKIANFGTGILGPPVWETDPNFLGGPAGASKPAPLPSIKLEALIEML
jgi:hypothetical protein